MLPNSWLLTGPSRERNRFRLEIFEQMNLDNSEGLKVLGESFPVKPYIWLLTDCYSENSILAVDVSL